MTLPRFHAVGEWSPGQVICRWTTGTFDPPAEVRQAIEAAWDRAMQRPGVNLFDGPMCRLEEMVAMPEQLELAISRTSYKAFLGTNMTHPQLADRFGPGVLANPIGLSCALVSADGFLMLGRRNERVAYYPGRIHPFAGSLEPADAVDIFEEARRELAEELSLGREDLHEMRCLGVAEDPSLRQPEVIVLAECRRTRAQIEACVDAAEHRASCAIEPAATSAESILNGATLLTPVCVATILLWGRRQFGQAWWERRSK